LRFSDQNFVWFCICSMCTMWAAHLILLNHPNIIGWWVQIMQLLIIWLSPSFCCLLFIGFKYSPQHFVVKHSWSEKVSFIPI
jgi:hypothetical protein